MDSSKEVSPELNDALDSGKCGKYHFFYQKKKKKEGAVRSARLDLNLKGYEYNA